MSTHLIKPHLLVVGGTGYIGYHLTLAAKKKGWKVTSISIGIPSKDRYVAGVNYLRIDISNLKKLKKKLVGQFTFVVNLGGYVNHASFKDKKNKLIKNHFIGLVNLTKIFSKKKN